MSLSRRRFIVLTALAGLWAKCGRLLASDAAEHDTQLQALAVWVDVLLPEDGLSPAGSALGVPQQILAKAATIRPYEALLATGLQWARQQALAEGGTSFAALSVEAREAIVAKAEGLGLKSAPGLFFYHTLRDGMAFYYGHEASWRGVGFPHAPQPIGFPDYMEASK